MRKLLFLFLICSVVLAGPTMATAVTVGSMNGNGNGTGDFVYDIVGGVPVIVDATIDTWSFSANFSFDNTTAYGGYGTLTDIFGDTGQYRFNASSSGVTAYDWTGSAAGTYGWTVTAYSGTTPLNSILRGSFAGDPYFDAIDDFGYPQALTFALENDGFVYWDDGDITNLPALGLPLDSLFEGVYTVYNVDLFTPEIPLSYSADFIFNGDVTATPVPEPATMLLLGTGLLGLAGFRKKSKI